MTQESVQDTADAIDYRGVLVDANASGGKFRAKEFKAWFDTCRARKLPLYVPRVVVWEWQEHVASDIEDARAAMSRINTALPETVSPLPAAKEVNAVVEWIPRYLEQIGVTIVEGEDAHYREAVRDQVRQLGVAEKKKDSDGRVKTGAADSAWIRGLPEGPLIIVTGDVRAKDQIRLLQGGDRHLLISNFRDIEKKLPVAPSDHTFDANAVTMAIVNSGPAVYSDGRWNLTAMSRYEEFIRVAEATARADDSPERDAALLRVMQGSASIRIGPITVMMAAFNVQGFRLGQLEPTEAVGQYSAPCEFEGRLGFRRLDFDSEPDVVWTVERFESMTRRPRRQSELIKVSGKVFFAITDGELTSAELVDPIKFETIGT